MAMGIFITHLKCLHTPSIHTYPRPCPGLGVLKGNRGKSSGEDSSDLLLSLNLITTVSKSNLAENLASII